jgi:hypothetical protein
MCRYVLALALVVFSNFGFSQISSTQRDWQFVGSFESGTVQYVDMKSLKKDGNYIRVQTLADHKNPEWWSNSEKIFSSITEQYIDCKRKRFALLSSAGFECHMARCASKETFSIPFSESEFKPVTSVGSKVGELSSEIGNLYALMCQ